MRHAGDSIHGRRLRGLIVVLWRAGLRIQRRSRSPKPTSIRVAVRCSSAEARAAGAVRSGWTTGPGSSLSPGSRRAWSCLSGRCSASSTAPRAGDRGRPPPHARRCAASPARLACGVGSRRSRPSFFDACVGRGPSAWRCRPQTPAFPGRKRQSRGGRAVRSEVVPCRTPRRHAETLACRQERA